MTKIYVKVREHTHTFEPVADIAYRNNTIADKFKKFWIHEFAVTLALMIPGAPVKAVTNLESPFYRAAKDVYYYLREDLSHQYWCVNPSPIYMDNGIALVYIRASDHRPEIKIYSNNNKSYDLNINEQSKTLCL